MCSIEQANVQLGKITTPEGLKILNEIIRPNLVVKTSDSVYLWSSNCSEWVHMSSPEGAEVIRGMLGLNAPVNWLMAILPYARMIMKNAGENIQLPQSICISNTRYSLEVMLKGNRYVAEFRPCRQLVKALPSSMDACAHTFAVSSIWHTVVPRSIESTYITAIERYIKPLFPNPVDMETFMWILGNAVTDPVSEHRILFLHGPGGTGKSTLMRLIHSMMSGTTRALDPAEITDPSRRRISHDLVMSLISTRMMVSPDVEIKDGYINLQTLKIITGGDYLSDSKVSGLLVKAGTSVALGVNHLPTLKGTPRWGTSAVLRRSVVVNMEVKARNLEGGDRQHNAKELTEFLMKCALTYASKPNLPISTYSLVTTLFPGSIHNILKYFIFQEDLPFQVYHWGTVSLATLMYTPTEDICALASEVSPAGLIRHRSYDPKTNTFKTLTAIRGLVPRIVV